MDIEESLRKMGCDLEFLVISSNIPVNDIGIPHSWAVCDSEDTGAAIYWIDKAGRPMALACDTYDTVVGNLKGIYHTLEALRTIERHGSSQLLERAFDGFAQLPKPWFITLGFDAPPGDIFEAKKAYRTLISSNHPDLGGSPDLAYELNNAMEDAASYYAAN